MTPPLRAVLIVALVALLWLWTVSAAWAAVLSPLDFAWD